MDMMRFNKLRQWKKANFLAPSEKEELEDMERMLQNLLALKVLKYMSDFRMENDRDL